MITVAIVAILAGIALPNYREFMMRMTVSENANTLVGALNTARAEAVKRGRQVALFANGGDWNQGWQIVAGKANADGTIDAPVPVASESDCTGDLDLDNETPLCPRYDGPVPATYRVLGKATGGVPDDTKVVFNATGALAGAVTNFDFSVCRPTTNPDPHQSKQVTVASSGIITTKRDTTGSPAGDCG